MFFKLIPYYPSVGFDLATHQDCQMAYVETKIGKFWRALQWKMYILWPFGLC
jgi:hypothetical protein